MDEEMASQSSQLCEEVKMATQTEKETTTWPEFAVSLFDKLTGRGAQITYEFDNFELFVPSKVGSQANHAQWKMNGVLNIRTSEQVNARRAAKNNE